MGLVKESTIGDAPVKGPLIGHTRYSTSSTVDESNAQPTKHRSGAEEYAVSHNGNVSNDRYLAEMLGINTGNISDTHILGELLREGIEAEGDKQPLILRQQLSKVVGSYSMAVLVGGKEPYVIAMRDKFGYMPLSIAETSNLFLVSSESVSFGTQYISERPSLVRDVRLGEIIFIKPEGMKSYIIPAEQQMPQHCWFQDVYMMRPDSNSVGLKRVRIGEIIASKYRPDVDMVVPVPDSGMLVAYGYANATGIPIMPGLIKDRYKTVRSFMHNGEVKRQEILTAKHNVNTAVVQGRNVLLIDDSVVRGATMKKIIELLHAAGAKKVYTAVSSPQIGYDCHFGIDFYRKQLIAAKYIDMNHEEVCAHVAKELGADGMYYMETKDLAKIIGVMEGSMCTSCLTGNYVQNVTTRTEEDRRRCS